MPSPGTHAGDSYDDAGVCGMENVAALDVAALARLVSFVSTMGLAGLSCPSICVPCGNIPILDDTFLKGVGPFTIVAAVLFSQTLHARHSVECPWTISDRSSMEGKRRRSPSLANSLSVSRRHPSMSQVGDKCEKRNNKSAQKSTNKPAQKSIKQHISTIS